MSGGDAEVAWGGLLLANWFEVLVVRQDCCHRTALEWKKPVGAGLCDFGEEQVWPQPRQQGEQKLARREG